MGCYFLEGQNVWFCSTYEFIFDAKPNVSKIVDSKALAAVRENSEIPFYQAFGECTEKLEIFKGNYTLALTEVVSQFVGWWLM